MIVGKAATSTSKHSALSCPSDDQSREEDRKSESNERNISALSHGNATASVDIQPSGERLEQYNVAANEAEEQENAEAIEKRKQEHELKFGPWTFKPKSNCPWAHDAER